MPDDDLFDNQAVSVGDYLVTAKRQLEETLPPVWIFGEIANFACPASGHWYFSLRDESAQLDCMMPARANRIVEMTPKNGDHVILFGHPMLYAARGRFQLAVRFLRFEGVGRLYQLFLQRKKQWGERGWFAAERKRQPPFFPEAVGVVCSPAGAARHDVERTLRTRLPAVKIILYSAPAQGADAAQRLAAAITSAGRRSECDVLLVCRGGGGIEDLWAYNEEAVVSAIVQSPIPVITGIGHESDDTLADFAADVRAPTPTAAAARAVPERAVLLAQLADAWQALSRSLTETMTDRRRRLRQANKLLLASGNVVAAKTTQLGYAQTALRSAVVRQCELLASRLKVQKAFFRAPDIGIPRQRCDDMARRLQAAMDIGTSRRRCDEATRRLQAAVAGGLQTARESVRGKDRALELLSPKQTLARGYSIVYDEQGRAVTDAAQLAPAAAVRLRFHRGAADAEIKKTDSGDSTE